MNAGPDESVPNGPSVVVPSGPGELAWTGLLGDLAKGAAAGEIILAGCENEPPEFSATLARTGMQCSTYWLSAPRGRASQLNTGAARATGQWLWFVHADSRLPAGWPGAIPAAMDGPGGRLYYGRLAFAADGPAMTGLNAACANLRSRLFGLPFGDQSLLVARRDFETLGGFDEDFGPGEDLEFVVRARRAGFTLAPLDLAVTTSGRRYRRDGWWRTTWKNLCLTPVLAARARSAGRAGKAPGAPPAQRRARGRRT